MTSTTRTSRRDVRSNGSVPTTERPAQHALGELTELGLPPAPDPDGRTSPRIISNAVSAVRHRRRDPWRRSEFLWAWGQFLDHELVLVEHPPGAEVPEPVRLPVPDDDPQIEFRGTTMRFTPSPRTETGGIPNGHTAVLDASSVYGPDMRRRSLLRGGAGRMKTSQGADGSELLPKHPGRPDIANAGVGDPSRFYLAGDVRSNEHGVLTAMHTVFVREHNRWAEYFRASDPSLTSDELFERARRLVVAEMQSITFREFLPALLGPDQLPAYGGYDSTVDPSISNIFATAAYRLGHSMVRNDVAISPGDHRLALADVFFNPEFVFRLGIEPFLSRLAYREIESIDTAVVPGLRNTLFTRGSNPVELTDLVALNIQRGRDHRLPTLNTCRRFLGLAPIVSFSDLTTEPSIVAALERVYADVDAIDLWVAGLAEQARDGRRIGDLLNGFIVDQFVRCRDGDPEWFERPGVLNDWERSVIDQTTLATVLARNTAGIAFSGDVFYVSH